MYAHSKCSLKRDIYNYLSDYIMQMNHRNEKNEKFDDINMRDKLISIKRSYENDAIE